MTKAAETSGADVRTESGATGIVSVLVLWLQGEMYE